MHCIQSNAGNIVKSLASSDALMFFFDLPLCTESYEALVPNMGVFRPNMVVLLPNMVVVLPNMASIEKERCFGLTASIVFKQMVVGVAVSMLLYELSR